MLKQIKKIAGAALLALAGLALPQGAHAQVALGYNVGDVLMGFYATGGSGASSSYVVNLGAASGFRDGTTTGALNTALGLGNIGTDLSNTFGATWRTDGNVFWGFISATSSNAATTVNGDPGRTLYGSSNGAALTRVGSNTQNSVISNINSMLAEQGFTVGGLSTANSNKASLKTNTSLTWNAFADTGAGGTGFSYGANLTGSPSASLDLYRIVRTGIDDGTGFTTGNGTLEGYFSIDNSGIVSFTAAVPEPSTYALLGFGLVALVALRRFRGAKQSNA